MVRPAEFNFIRSFSTKVNKQKSLLVASLLINNKDGWAEGGVYIPARFRVRFSNFSRKYFVL
jgi:hypothetical protein